MSNNNKEIEIQVIVEDSKKLLEFLKQDGEFHGTTHQKDEYFNPPHRDFLAVRPIVEWFRIREEEGGASINYKYWHYEADGRSHYCDEYETPVGNAEQTRKTLEALGFVSICVVDKTRTIWMYKDYEVVFDVIPGLEDSIEIEYKGEGGDLKPAEVTEDMLRFLKEHGCGKIRRSHQGYPFRLLFPKEVLYEDVHV